MDTSGLRLNVADLRHHPGSRRDVHLDVPTLADVEVGATRLDDRLTIDATLEPVSDAIVVRARVRGRYVAPCSRCLGELAHDFDCELQELFEPEPLEGETYALGGDQLDLEPAVRDAVVLELPVAPLCRDECRGLCPVCGADRNERDCGCDPNPPDPRWEALHQLKL